MKKVFLASVADVIVYKGDQLISYAETLTDTSIDVTTTLEEVRAGKGNKLWAKYAHTGGFNVTLNNIMFSSEWMSANIGSPATIGGTAIYEEAITASANDTLTVTETPYEFMDFGVIGWFRNENESDWTKMTQSSGKVFTATGVVSGETYCVKYIYTNNAMEVITVPANIVPDVCSLVIRAQLFSGETFETATNQVGVLEIEVPRFMFNGTQTLSMTAAGVASNDFSGSALVSNSNGCAGGGEYAKVKTILYDAKFYDNMIDLAIEGSTLVLNDYVVTRGIYKNGTTKILDPTLLTYTATGCTVNATTGQITAVATDGTVKVTIAGAGLPANIAALEDTIAVSDGI